MQQRAASVQVVGGAKAKQRISGPCITRFQPTGHHGLNVSENQLAAEEPFQPVLSKSAKRRARKEHRASSVTSEEDLTPVNAL